MIGWEGTKLREPIRIYTHNGCTCTCTYTPKHLYILLIPFLDQQNKHFHKYMSKRYN
jgi:hypothetical protein